jgi:cytochrome c oxidase assembly factor CtaG
MTEALLQSWNLRIEIILPLLLVGMLYLRGWRRLRAITDRHRVTERQNPRPPLAASWKPAAYIGGLLLLAVALMSPIDTLGSQLFYMHMIQHLLLVMFVPPLLLIASPYPMILWGLSSGPRHKIASVLNQESGPRKLITKLTAPGIVWFLYIATYIGWHDPGMYNLALRSEVIHDLEHVTFFATAVLFWWHVTGAAPRFHRTFTTGKRLLYLIAAIPANMFTGIAIAFASQPIYSYYTTVPRFYGLSVMEDQILAGVIMWIPGSMMLLLAALILISRIVQTEANKPPTPNPTWNVGTSER